MLNGKVCYLRGAEHHAAPLLRRSAVRRLPWDEAWVRKFLVDIPRRMHWNAFRICIGPPPQQWLDMADEAGSCWSTSFPSGATASRCGTSFGSKTTIVEQFGQFIRDSWNHPSVVLWDASNETHWEFLGKKLVPAVRGLDLSGRPWENGYEPPQGARRSRTRCIPTSSSATSLASRPTSR